MTITTYEIRSKAGRPLMQFESQERAKQEIALRAKRVPGLRLFKIIRTAQEIEL